MYEVSIKAANLSGAQAIERKEYVIHRRKKRLTFFVSSLRYRTSFFEKTKKSKLLIIAILNPYISKKNNLKWNINAPAGREIIKKYSKPFRKGDSIVLLFMKIVKIKVAYRMISIPYKLKRWEK